MEPEVEWLQEGVQPAEEFEQRAWHGLYFAAFDALQCDRFIGSMGGEGPIYYQALSQYARDHRIEGDDLRLFHLFMNVIDGEYLKMQREEAAEAEARDKDREDRA